MRYARFLHLAPHATPYRFMTALRATAASLSPSRLTPMTKKVAGTFFSFSMFSSAAVLYRIPEENIIVTQQVLATSAQRLECGQATPTLLWDHRQR